MATDRHGFLTWSAGFTQSDTILNDLLDKLEVKVGASVISRTTTAQPGSPTAGDMYIIPGSATGAAWSTFDEHDIAIYRSGAWVAFAPIKGWPAWVEDDANGVMWNGTAWTIVSGGLLNKYDATTAPTTGDDTGDGYSPGSHWVDVTNDKAYVCLDATAAAAVWTEITQAGATSTDEWTIYVETVGDQDYVLTYDAPYAADIDTLRTKTEAGTCTVTGKIESTALGGTANSASTSAQEQAHASANSVSKGDKVLVTVSSNSGATDLEITFYVTRT